MKKLFLLLALVLVFFKVSAQTPCTVDSSLFPKGTTFGIYPDSLTAPANYPYSQTMQFKFPKDTVYGMYAVIIDSVHVDSVKTLPKTFAYECMSKTCSYKGGSYGCAVITGSPVNNQAGVYNLEIHFTVFAHPTGISLELPVPDSGAIKLTIDSNHHSAGIFYPTANPGFEVSQNYPNPFNQNTEISFNSPDMQPVSFMVINELGQQVYAQKLQALQGANSFRFERSSLPPGMYFYRIQQGTDIITKSMVIKD